METITCIPETSCTVPVVNNALDDATGVCTESTGSIANEEVCTVRCATGHTPNSATAVCTAGTMETITCIPDCSVPVVENANDDATGVCTESAVSIVNGAACTVRCATGHTPNRGTAACTAGTMETITCIPDATTTAAAAVAATTTAAAAMTTMTTTAGTTTMTAAAAATTTTDGLCACSTAPLPVAVVTFTVTISMSVEDAISAFNASAYESQLASTYEADADVTVVTLFKVKVSYSFSGSVTEAEVKPAIVEANNVDESDVTVTVASGRRLQSARRLQSTVSAEISTESQDELAGLKTSMETALEVDGETATAGTATVDVELVTTVVQSTAAAPPEPDAVGLFFPNIETTVDVGAA